MIQSYEQSVVDLEGVDKILDDLMPIAAKYPVPHMILAGLMMALGMQNPDLTPEQMQKGLEGTSKYIAQYLEGLQYGGLTSKMVN